MVVSEIPARFTPDRLLFRIYWMPPTMPIRLPTWRRIARFKFGETNLPELPEVETVKRGLLRAMEGRRFTRAETRRSDLRVMFPVDFQSRLVGRRVNRLWR